MRALVVETPLGMTDLAGNFLAVLAMSRVLESGNGMFAAILPGSEDELLAYCLQVLQWWCFTRLWGVAICTSDCRLLAR